MKLNYWILWIIKKQNGIIQFKKKFKKFRNLRKMEIIFLKIINTIKLNKSMLKPGN